MAVLWIGFFFLEGFDFGVAMLLPILGKKDEDRRVMINTIGPTWDGNVVWLLTAGGASCAAFPAWYATLFSGLYLPLFLVLLGLILRGVAFEYRNKKPDASWKAMFDWFAIGGSFVVALVLGVGFANFVRGMPDNDKYMFTGSFWSLFHPFALVGGLLFVALFLTHGAVFIALKTKGEIRERARDFAQKVGVVAAALMAIFFVWQNLGYRADIAPALGWVVGLLAVACVAGAVLMSKAGREGVAFILSGLATVLMVVGIFATMYPNLGFDNAAAGNKPLNIVTASSSPLTLKIMTIAAVIFVPIVLAYQAWTYWIFSRRISTKNLPVEEAAPATAH